MRLALAVSAVGLAGLAGCVQYETGPVTDEQAAVVSAHHEPSRVVPSVTFDSEGHVRPSLRTIPDSWEVELNCQHGLFTLDDEDSYGLYGQRTGQKVTVTYQITYRLTHGKEPEARREVASIRHYAYGNAPRG